MYRSKEMISRILLILLGSLITAVGINAFIIPHSLISGGIGGIAIIIQYVTGIPSGYLILLLNIPIFLIGMKEIDSDFIIFSLIGMVGLSVFLILTKDISMFFKVDDILLSSIYGGVIMGIGVGMVLRYRASQGGTDIIAVVFKKKSGMNISTLSFSMNLVVVAIGASLSSIETALYTLVAMYISSMVMDRVIEGIERKKLLFIVTCREEEVTNAIMKEIGRGVTFFYGEGAYTGDKKKILYCIVTSKQLSKAKKLIEDIDSSAFMSIIDAGEVQGKGFKKPVF